MGIHNLHILTDPDAFQEKGKAVSRHIVTNKKGRFVFGWDNMLQSFFLQLHDPNLSEEENPAVWLGADAKTEMYEVEHLVQAASEHGLWIDHSTQVQLYGEKDDGV